jgi:hypothetical protein
MAVSIPTALSYRNVVFSGLLERLQARTNLIVAGTSAARQPWDHGETPELTFWELPPGGSDRRHELFFSSLQHAFFKQYGVNTWDMINRYRHRDKARPFRQRLRTELYRCLAPIGWTNAGWRALRQAEEQSFHASVPGTTLETIKDSGITTGFSTVCKLAWEWPLFRTLQRLGIPTLTHILSFDNLTSVGFLPIQGFDRYLCWSRWLADQLEEFYEVRRDRIEITGTPQFDFHILPRFHWDQARTRTELRLDLARPYILYCANLRVQTPREPELVSYLVRAFADDPGLREYQWVVRFHPSDDYNRWAEIKTALGSRVQFCEPWGQAKGGALHWGRVEEHGVALLTNSVRHASCIMSMGSTLALDCAVLDQPIVNVGFHPDRGSTEDIYYANAHKTFHYHPITESGAAPVAANLPELLDLVREAIRHPTARSPQRQQLRDRICGPVDGRSADRIYAALDRLLPAAARRNNLPHAPVTQYVPEVAS